MQIVYFLIKLFATTTRRATYVHTVLLLLKIKYINQGTKLTFLARSRLAPKFSKVVAKAKKLGAIKKKR